MPSDCFINRCRELGILNRHSEGLDVGCGPHIGVLAKYGVDLAKGYCNYEWVDAEGEHHKCVLTARSDAVHLPFRDNSFYYVVSSHVGEHIGDFKGFVREQMRVASDIVIVCVPLYLEEEDQYRKGASCEQGTNFAGETMPHLHSWGTEDYSLDPVLRDLPEEAKVTRAENVPHNISETNIWIDVNES